MISSMVAKKLHGDGRVRMSMTIRNGVITMALVMAMMVQYHLLVSIDHSIDRFSRREPILFLCFL